MKKYLVTTYANAEWQCIVYADDDATMEEVEEKVWEGDYIELNNGDPTNVQDLSLIHISEPTRPY